MKISDLPPGLRELAEKRGSKFHWPVRETLAAAFGWYETPEGFEFWNQIEEGDFTPYYNCRVVNFRLKVHVIT